MEIVPEEVKQLVVKGNLEKTVENFRNLKNKNYSNFIYAILNYEHPHYSTRKIASKIKVSRVQSSDMIDIKYQSDDAAICKNTLDFIVQVFIEEYTTIKINQSDAVVQYFQKQLKQADEKLNEAENELLRFNQSNTIINYYEQTKHIASEKEHFDLAHQEIQRDKVAAESVLSILEEKMTATQKQFVNNKKILDLRNSLSELNTQIALKTYENESDSAKEKSLISNIASLKTRSFDIQEELKNSVREQFSMSNTTEGLPSSSVLTEWLSNVIKLEAAKAKLIVADIQKKEYERLFSSYAPLGATMKRLERKINVAEREYLSILQSLGQAKLKQQNIELNSNLRIIAPPFFPIVAEPSKRKFIVLIAFMIGFLIPTFIIIVLDFLNNNIKTWARVEELTGLNVAAVYPNTSKVSKYVDIDTIEKRALDIIARKLILNIASIENKRKPSSFLFFSSLEKEGKTRILRFLLKRLTEYGYKILYISYEKDKISEEIEQIIYSRDNSFHRAEKIEDLTPEKDKNNLSNYDFIFIEIPGVLNNSYPINLFKTVDVPILVTRANRQWLKSDSFAIKDILEASDKEPQVFLNGVELQEMEDLIGEIPRKRSRVRRFLKRLILLKFSSKDKLSIL
ncbi:GumC family protein [Maribellus maritimus]|uniref:GumC family protein n=1 Tax=Maribellus maritimus TaxID=2870838 RepID=UPI001EECE15B|nr:hypothetical protein [Maribellus maritimus]MCG6186912.1 hypothetical protein [Maribellus maritimus]